MIKWEKASACHSLLIADLEKAVFTDAWSEKAVSDFLLSPHSCSYILYDNTLPIAELLASSLLGEAEILRIAVLPTRRGEGHASRLLSLFLAEEAPKRVFLEVREHNLPARRLYEKFGFKEQGKRLHYYKNPTEDAVLYEYAIKTEKELSL